ncbi:MAG: hypothetical protein R2798_14130 [Chitinophagales bacterium]|nr:hypothetical protein [Bacteroidota bacterium]MCB9043428.1 hypothetical protein [Chitinophagales bacterium]
MKQIFVILLALLVILINFREAAIFVSFKYNQEFIAQYLCINRDKPEMQCHGKCHLKKSIEESEKRQQQGANPINEKPADTTLFFTQTTTVFGKYFYQTSNIKTFSSFLINLYKFSFHIRIFHPPQFR